MTIFPILFFVPLQNRSDSSRTIKALLSSSSIYYTGITANPIKKAQGEFTLSPGQSKMHLEFLFPRLCFNFIRVHLLSEDTLALTIYPDDYLGRLVDYCMVKIYALIRVRETNQTWSDEDDFVLEKPKLKVTLPQGPARKHRLLSVDVEVRNPLPVALTGGRLAAECAGVVRRTTERVGEVPPGETVRHKVKNTF